MISSLVYNIATAVNRGLMSAADKIKLDAATANATASTLVLRAADGSVDNLGYKANGVAGITSQIVYHDPEAAATKIATFTNGILTAHSEL